MDEMEADELTDERCLELAGRLREIASEHGMAVGACAERLDMTSVGVERNACIDAKLIERLIGARLGVGKDQNQREECGCVASIDMGAYNTCANGCRYCYANFNPASVKTNMAEHDPDSPLLIGRLGPEDKVTDRKVCSLKETQMRLF